MEQYNCFTSPYRRCGYCDKLRTRGNFSFCTRCKIFVYCDKDCQAKHWKSAHKESCKVPIISAPPLPVYSPLLTGGDGVVLSDIDRPYKFILIKPTKNDANVQMSKEDWQMTVQGINDRCVLGALEKQLALGKYSSVIHPLLQQTFGWNHIGSSCPPGYSAQFNGYVLRGLYDDDFQSRPELGSNLSAAYLYHQDAAKWHGALVLYCAVDWADLKAVGAVSGVGAVANNAKSDANEEAGEGNGTSTAGEASHEDANRADEEGKVLDAFLTRRQVLDTIEHHALCGSSAYRTVPERVRHENIARAAGLKMFRKEQFHVL